LFRGNASSTEAGTLEFKFWLACVVYLDAAEQALAQSHVSTLAMLLITFIAILHAREQKDQHSESAGYEGS
jgi:hypothetical protein